MSEMPRILRDPFPRELNPELFKSHIDWEKEEKILAEEEKQERREKIRSFLKRKSENFKIN